MNDILMIRKEKRFTVPILKTKEKPKKKVFKYI